MINIDTFLQCLLNGFVVGSAYTLVAIGLTMIFGVLHIPNFGHGNLLMLGAFFTLFAGKLFGVGYFGSFLVAVTLDHRHRHSFLFCTFQAGKKPSAPEFIDHRHRPVFLSGSLRHFDDRRANPVGIHPGALGGLDSSWAAPPSANRNYCLLVVTPLLIFATYWFVYRTKIGSSVRAVAQDPFAAALVGIKENQVMMITFALASALAGIAGALVGGIPGQAITPTMASMLTAKAFIIVIFGGLGSMTGAIIAGYIIGLTESIGAGLFQGYLPFFGKGYADAYAFILLLVLVAVKPEGLFGEK